MRVHTIRIPCKDLGASEQFYSRLLGMPKAFGDVGTGYIGFALDNATLMIEHVEPGEFEANRYLGFSLEVPDIQAFYDDQKADVQFSGPPKEQPWGGIMNHVTDINGNTLSIVQMLAP